MRLFARLALAAWTAGMLFILLVVATWFATEWIAPAAGPVEFGAGQAEALLHGLATAAAVLLPPALAAAAILRIALAVSPLRLTAKRIAVFGAATVLAGMLLQPVIAETRWDPWEYVRSAFALTVIGGTAGFGGWCVAFGPGGEAGGRAARRLRRPGGAERSAPL
ncbi:hypothetical protein [Mangrovicoccus sp. HB161399]|uniref:hypothetical protein n=1 Tax=Mangrovicoccus sp. HB161399 TaxID=2720392 RepID=UPI0015571736|nr:hypothetical protein [Mangrovicoccus sp. HB161399]